MVTVKHKAKGRSYDYPDEQTALLHAAQAVEQSKGELKHSKDKDGSIVVDYVSKKERE